MHKMLYNNEIIKVKTKTSWRRKENKLIEKKEGKRNKKHCILYKNCKMKF